MKRAAILVTDAEVINLSGSDYWSNSQPVYTSELMLDDLKMLASEGAASDIPHLRNAASRVLDALNK